MKVANTDAVRKGEYISDYEHRVYEELQKEALRTKKGYCPKGHLLTIIFDRKEVPQYEANASCDKCESIINLDDIYIMGFLHCKICEYDVCTACRYGGAKEQANEEMMVVEETVELSDQWSVENQPKTQKTASIGQGEGIDLLSVEEAVYSENPESLVDIDSRQPSRQEESEPDLESLQQNQNQKKEMELNDLHFMEGFLGDF